MREKHQRFMSLKPKEYIEILRVVSDDNRNNVASRPEVIEAENIKSFRPWHKGPKDKLIEGDMTVIVLIEKSTDDGQEKEIVKTKLIEEAYENFRDRMSLKVIIKKLN